MYYEDAELLRKAVERIKKRERPEEEVDPMETWCELDVMLLEEGKKKAVELHGVVHERVGIEDVTPAGDPPGILWDWEERIAWDPLVEVKETG